jgi:uncharacterized spore protein YtfJ
LEDVTMDEDRNQAYADAEAAASSGAARMLEAVLERIGLHAGARAVFGDAVERDGRSVIPVAQTMFGAGAGSGRWQGSETGEGAGGGTLSRPVGYIEISAQGTEFVPLRRPWQEPALVIAYALVGLIAVRALVRLVRR